MGGWNHQTFFRHCGITTIAGMRLRSLRIHERIGGASLGMVWDLSRASAEAARDAKHPTGADPPLTR